MKYTCRTCSYSTARSNDLLKHVQRKHNAVSKPHRSYRKTGRHAKRTKRTYTSSEDSPSSEAVHYSPISDDPAPIMTRKETIADFIFDSGSSHSDVSEVLAIKDHGPSPTRIVTTFFVPICISDTDVGSPEASCSTYPTNLRIQVKPITSNPLSLQNPTPQSTITSDMHATFLQLHTKWEARLDSRIATQQIALDSTLNKKILEQDIAATHVYRSLNSVLDTQFEDLTRSLESKIEPLITTHLGTAQSRHTNH